VADLETQLQAARARLHQAAESLVDWSAQADEVLSVSAQRSRAPDVLADAKRALADARVDARLAALSQAPARRPKGPGGHVRRSEPVTCADCIKYGATPEESFVIHHPELLPPLKVMEERTDQAERRGPGSYTREISR
jgi:hypothetical protein